MDSRKFAGAFGVLFSLALFLWATHPTAAQQSAETLAQKSEQVQDQQPSWVGTLDLGVAKLRLKIDVVPQDDGTLSATLFSIDQGNAKIPLDSFVIDGKKLTFAAAAIQAKFEGTLNDTGREVVGTFTQFGRATDLAMTLEDDPQLEPPQRPQHPQPPFPYTSEEVTIENSAAEDVILAGTLTLPEGEGNKKFPAVILVSGSGPQDRDETLLGHKPFWVIADHLTRQGIAVLRYDDRGIGKSAGDFGSSTSEDFASDAEAALDFLRQHEKVDAKRIGMIGHSEGGLIASLLVPKAGVLAHAIMLAGPGIPGDEVLRTQTKAMLEVAGEDTSQLELLNKAIEKTKVGTTADELMALTDEYLESLPEEEREDAAAIKAGMVAFATPWFHYFVNYDPAPMLAQAKCPVLALIGTKDLQVLVDANLPAIQKALDESPAKGHRCQELEGLNHLFQVAATGSPAEYASIEQTMSPEVLDIMAEWIQQH